MPHLIWSPAALLDVQRLYRFLVPKNAQAASSAMKTLRQSVQILALQPGIGRPAQDMEPEYREWLIDFGQSGYVALHHFDGQAALIVAVRHQKELDY